jgi:hypothetical protein
VHRDTDYYRSKALEALRGVGDSSLGQWEEDTGKAYHIRRRLSVAEQASTGPVKDIRGTEEARRRLAGTRNLLPQAFYEFEAGLLAPSCQ